MRFLKREGKKCSARSQGTIEKGTLGLVDLGWMELDWTGQGRAGQDNSARGSKSRCEGCRMQPGGDCMGFERNEDRRKRGQVSRYRGIQVPRFPRAGARTSERQCHTVRSVAASGTKWSEVALKVGLRFQDRSVQQAVRWPPKELLSKRERAPPKAPKLRDGGEGRRGGGLDACTENRNRPPRRTRQTTDCVARLAGSSTKDSLRV